MKNDGGAKNEVGEGNSRPEPQERLLGVASAAEL
jgi:hypothetical protein